MCQPVTIIFFWLLSLPLLVVMLFFPTSLCGVLVFDSVSRLRLARLARHLCHTPSSHTTLSHTIFPISHTTLSPTIFHTQLCHTHTTLSHTIFHTPLCHPPSFTHNFVTHHLSHTTLSPTIFHTQLCHTPSFTHTPPLCHPPSFIRNFGTHHLSHTTLSHTHTQLYHTPSFTHHFVTHHLLVTSTFVLCGRRGTCGTGLALVAPLSVLWSPVTQRYFAWQAWHLAPSTWQAWRLVTSTFILRDRRGACGTGLALSLARQ